MAAPDAIQTDYIGPKNNSLIWIGPCNLTPGSTLNCDIHKIGADPLHITGDAGIDIHSGTNIVDFNGATLINVGGVTIDPDVFQIVEGPIDTVSNVTVTLLDLTTVTDSVYTATVQIIAKDLALMTYTYYNYEITMRNQAGVVDVVLRSLTSQINEVIVTQAVAYAIVGTHVHFNVTGELGQTVRWKAECNMLRNL